MGPKTSELLGALTEMITLLECANEQRWAEWMKQAKTWIERSDYSGVTKVLSAYGGMGSFNDLVLHPINGHNVDDINSVNQQLSVLRTLAWNVARAIRSEQTPNKSLN